MSSTTPSSETAPSTSSFVISTTEDDTNSKFRQTFNSKSVSNINSYTTEEMGRINEILSRTDSHPESQNLRNFTKRQKMTLASLALVEFISFCSMSIMAPFFPREAARKGLSETTSGFIFSFYALIMFVSSPIFGKILPRFGAKFLFLGGMLTAGFCNLLFGTLEYVDNYTLFTGLCIVIRGFEALGASAFSTASYVFVITTFPNNIGSVLGILQTFLGLGMSTGPALGGFLYSLGGFNMPFFVLGFVIIVFVPINACLLPNVDDCKLSNKPTSIWKLLKLKDVIIIGLVVVMLSMIWSFLDPTLEPHLRQFNLTPAKIGLVFLLFSALYGIFSPIWGLLADKINNHWSMMVIGLFFNMIGLLLLGPFPLAWFLPNSLWLNLVALSILGISVALGLLPTFQRVLNSAINNGFDDSLSTYGVVAGIWASMFSLGEMIGPLLGGFLLQHYGFPVTSTIMAFMTFIIGVATLIFFSLISTCSQPSNISSDSGISEACECYNGYSETTPLLASSDATYRMYTEEMSYEKSIKYNNEVENPHNEKIANLRRILTS